VTAVAAALEEGVLPGRLWFYANYHCNLVCTYCLIESGPRVERRELGKERMLSLAREAAALGFTALGVTGGEPFLLPYLPELLPRLAAILPLVCLTNGTVFTERRLERLRPLAELPAAIQISLDRPEPDANDAMRGPENFRKVVDVIPRLVERGVRVRVATTVAPSTTRSGSGSARCTGGSACQTPTTSSARSCTAAAPSTTASASTPARPTSPPS